MNYCKNQTEFAEGEDFFHMDLLLLDGLTAEFSPFLAGVKKNYLTLQYLSS